MSENPIAITKLNDFIFCPVSIYYHNLEEDTEKSIYQSEFQINGTAAHEKSDNAEYSTKKNILQGISVYSQKYNLYGKIDVFDIDRGVLTERKKKIKTIYDGYIYQLYAQYFALIEMGYNVKYLKLYSMDDNKSYKVKMPDDDIDKFNGFCELIDKINNFDFYNFKQENKSKCSFCIYEPLCPYSKLKE